MIYQFYYTDLREGGKKPVDFKTTDRLVAEKKERELNNDPKIRYWFEEHREETQNE